MQILTSVLYEIHPICAREVEEASMLALEVLNNGYLSSKLYALEYFKKVFSNAVSELTPTQKTYQLRVLLAIDNMLKKLPFWLSMEKNREIIVHRFKNTVMDIFEVYRTLISGSHKKDCKMFLVALLQIISTFQSVNERLSEKWKDCDKMFIYGEELISHSSLDLEEEQIREILGLMLKNYQVIKLLELTVIKEAKHEVGFYDVFNASPTWKEITQFLSTRAHELPDYQLYFREIMRISVNVAQKSQKKCFGSTINAMIDLFKQFTLTAKSPDTRLFILIAQDFVSLPDFRESDQGRQRFVMEVIISPLALFLKRQSSILPADFANLMLKKQSVSNDQMKMEFVSLRTLFGIRENAISHNLFVEVREILKTVLLSYQNLSFDLHLCVIPLINNAILGKLLNLQEIHEIFISKVLQEEKYHVFIAQCLKQLICIQAGHITLECSTVKHCSNTGGPIVECNPDFLDPYLKLFASKNDEVLFNMIECLESLAIHFPKKSLDIALWTPLLEHEHYSIREKFAYALPQLVENVYTHVDNENRREEMMRAYQQILLGVIQKTVWKKKTKYKDNHATLLLLDKFTEVQRYPEQTFLHFFKMIFIFIINTDSQVTCDAAILGRDMCIRRGIAPRDMLNWYREDVLKITVRLSVEVFKRKNVEMRHALNQVSTMMGYLSTKDFIRQHFKLIIAMLLPYCIRNMKCEKLLEDVCKQMKMELNEMLTVAFVTIYTYLYHTQSTEVNNKCIDFVIQHTGQSLYHLMHTDIKSTIPEVLVYYHKNPNFVMHAFKSLLSKNEVTLSGMADYISTRFLGVLVTFESIIVSPETEKALKKETLQSLGDIVRFMGSEHVTPYRFKILTLLKTALMIEDDGVKTITASVWTIFLRTVDVQCLGPLLSTIIVSLEPLLEHQQQQVGEIFRYLIIENRSLLSAHFGELFFIEDTCLEDTVKAVVSSQRRTLKQSFAEEFDMFRKHVNHENLEVRTHGFNHLSELFAENRTDLNRMVFDQLGIDSILVGCIDTMMQGCRHIDENLQLASGVCLGEMGALEPSHLPPNYAPQKQLALSVHSDEFAIMALAELCRAYQFQKDSHHVDSFSLAIQEILQARGVCPKQSKKLAVWQAIPERMRQLMEPLLTSCYKGTIVNNSAEIHPVFGSSKCHSLKHWIFIWASNMVFGIEDKFTKHLLNSFLPSIKHDMQTMAMFLPYIILQGLLHSTEENRGKIAEEFKKVFAAAAMIGDTDDISQIDSHCRGVRSLGFVATHTTVTRESKDELVIKCAKMASNQLDFLETWLQQSSNTRESTVKQSEMTLVREFIDQFDGKLLALANFKSGENARSLQFLEQYISQNPTKLQEELPLLMKIYAELMDPDNVEGAIGLMRTKLPLPEQIAMNTVTGRVSESSVCFEKLIQMGEITPSLMNSLVQYYVALDHPETALLVSESLLNKFQDFNVDKLTLELRAEPLWQMGRFEELDDMITRTEVDESDGWGIRCGALLLAYRQDNEDSFTSELRKARLSIMKSLKCAEIEQNAYQKSYSDVQKLHMITEIEKAFTIMKKLSGNVSEEQGKHLMEVFFKDWDARIQLLRPSTRIVEPVLRLRRILLTQGREVFMQNSNRPLIKSLVTSTIDNEMAKLWHKSAELARKEGLYQQAQLYLLNLEEYRRKDSFLERAKLLWSQGDQPNTFQLLEQGLKNFLEDEGARSFKNLSRQAKIIYAEGKFLIADYNAESMNIETELNIGYFREAVEAFPESEKTLVHYAQFLDKIFNSLPEEQQIAMKGTDLLRNIMTLYGKSLQFGCNYLFQSMPRLLSIWLDYTALPVGCDKRVSKQLTELALKFSDTLPSYMFFTAFSQLVSRICHPSTDVYQVLRTILIKLIHDYPQQSLWMILSVLKSSYPSRSRRCIELLNDQRLREQPMQRLICDFNKLAEKLIELTNKAIPSHMKDPKVSNLVPQLAQMFNEPNFSRIVIPAQKFMQPELPSTSERDAASANHNAFPRRMYYIQSMRNSMVVLRSMQKPRKVVLLADDGLEYSVLMKPKDDLRKDFRLMEFNAVVKQYLKQDPEARQRRLGIRTYAVLPLNEECGIIEWVSNLTTLRSILLDIYKCKNLTTDQSDLKRIEAKKDRETKSGKTDIFVNILCKRHPPVFAEWFKSTFTTPFNWYQARSSFIRTTAVMSIVGYILGLGDRHGENILLDHTNGDTVHVDFNCLFNKGESLGVPEVVPFRLTHNMVHAMGPLGTEGLFRKCCEVTLRVLQMQTSTLMSVLRPFVYDPLVSWNKNSKDRSDGTRERTDPQALTNLNHIEERLKGFVKINGRLAKMPLSTEGQVNFVIKEATNVDNLGAMYIGWGAYL
ncbi:serine/threonine-protein kinase ATR-like [Phlebotomus argentipes]|uniref:serine/threonine-protein kinase ATR-like n=1 Tax=Phlebotomus argentipes TaxID=94469 RepID=UPI0028932D36|nr:serine/threonine-protein kinase ATR-like [Phlebotomus argentipes]